MHVIRSPRQSNAAVRGTRLPEIRDEPTSPPGRLFGVTNFEQRRSDFARGLGFLALTVLCYGTLWPVSRMAVQFLSPYWFAFARLGLGCVILFAILAISRRLRFPPKQDWPVVVSVGAVMLGIYACLFQLGLQIVDAGRAALLGYTVPVWVLPLSVILTGELPTARRLGGAGLAIAGLAVLFNPLSFDWDNGDVVLGNGLLLLAALIWAPVLLHLRMSRTVLTTLELLPWQLLMAIVVVAAAGLIFEGVPTLVWTVDALALTAYGGSIGVALGFYAINSTMRLLPPVTSSVGVLAVPVFSLILSVLFLGEVLTWSLGLGLCLVLGGVALVSVPDRRG